MGGNPRLRCVHHWSSQLTGAPNSATTLVCPVMPCPIPQFCCTTKPSDDANALNPNNDGRSKPHSTPLEEVIDTLAWEAKMRNLEASVRNETKKWVVPLFSGPTFDPSVTSLDDYVRENLERKRQTLNKILAMKGKANEARKGSAETPKINDHGAEKPTTTDTSENIAANNSDSSMKGQAPQKTIFSSAPMPDLNKSSSPSMSLPDFVRHEVCDGSYVTPTCIIQPNLFHLPPDPFTPFAGSLGRSRFPFGGLLWEDVISIFHRRQELSEWRRSAAPVVPAHVTLQGPLYELPEKELLEYCRDIVIKDIVDIPRRNRIEIWIQNGALRILKHWN